MKENLVVRQFELGQLANYNYLIGDPQTRTAAFIDPGDETDFLTKEVKKEDWQLIAILLTHGHYDHIGGVIELCLDFDIPAYISKHEAHFYQPDCKKLVKVQDNESIRLGDATIECLHTPGHTPGCQCFYAGGNLFSGDTLFIDAIGRTDLPGGNTAQMFQSLQRIKKLPGTTVVWPGHNYGATPCQTLDVLKKENPYLACEDLQEFLELAG